MALRISREQAKDKWNIIKTLIFTPANDFTQNERPIIFFKTGKDYVDLPYTFGISLFQIVPKNNYPRRDIQFTGFLYSHQEPVELEAYNILMQYGSVIIGLYPGFGKTILAAKISSRIKMRTCVLVPRIILAQQWKKTFQDFTRCTCSIVGLDSNDSDVLICMDQRVTQISQEILDSIGLLIIDEAHMFCTRNKVESLLSFHPHYVIAETATLYREDLLHNMIYAVCGNKGVFKISTKKFSVFKVLTGIVPERRDSVKGLDYNHLVKTTLFNDARDLIILELIKNNLDHKILILTKLVQHVKILEELLIKNGIDCDSMSGSKNSYSDLGILIGTISKLGTGFDEATGCNNYSGVRIDMVIICTSIKKVSLLEQTVGRGFRSDFPTIYHLVDSDSVYERHFSNCAKWYRSRNGTIEIVNFA